MKNIVTLEAAQLAFISGQPSRASGGAAGVNSALDKVFPPAAAVAVAARLVAFIS